MKHPFVAVKQKKVEEKKEASIGDYNLFIKFYFPHLVTLMFARMNTHRTEH